MKFEVYSNCHCNRHYNWATACCLEVLEVSQTLNRSQKPEVQQEHSPIEPWKLSQTPWEAIEDVLQPVTAHQFLWYRTLHDTLLGVQE